jgi:hypothetical protein
MAVRGLLGRNFLHLNFAALTKLLETLVEMFDRITILQVFDPTLNVNSSISNRLLFKDLDFIIKEKCLNASISKTSLEKFI